MVRRVRSVRSFSRVALQVGGSLALERGTLFRATSRSGRLTPVVVVDTEGSRNSPSRASLVSSSGVNAPARINMDALVVAKWKALRREWRMGDDERRDDLRNGVSRAMGIPPIASELHLQRRTNGHQVGHRMRMRIRARPLYVRVRIPRATVD